MTGPYPTLSGLGADRLREDRHRVVVVGAGGWLGLAALEALWELMGEAGFQSRVLAFGSSRRTLHLRGGRSVAQAPLGEIASLPRQPTLALYLGYLTQENAGRLAPEAYVESNQRVSRLVYDALDPIGADAVFVASSGNVELVEVVGADPGKSLFGALKRADEMLFSAWAERTGGRAAIARIFGLSGPYIDMQDSNALACFIRDALEDRPITVRALHPVFRSYVAVYELLSVALGVMLDGRRGVTEFETGADRAFELGEVASIVAQTLGHRRGIRRPDPLQGLEDRHVGDGRVYERLRDELGVRAASLEEQIQETARFMRQEASVGAN